MLSAWFERLDFDFGQQLGGTRGLLHARSLPSLCPVCIPGLMGGGAEIIEVEIVVVRALTVALQKCLPRPPSIPARSVARGS